jgi:hypothetical protein
MTTSPSFFSRTTAAGLLAALLSGGAIAANGADAPAPTITKAPVTPAPTAAKSPSSSAAAKPTPPAASSITPQGSFDSFRLISDRNIFDPNRYSRSARAAAPAEPTGDTIAFVGTMDYDKGLFAFFDSPDARYRKVLPEGGMVGDFAVKHIAATSVDLTRGDKMITLQITQQLRRPDGGDWSVISPNPAPAAATTDSGAPPIPPGASDILKRLMEQRQQQLKQ